ncbi:serine hydrolase domain-containing protein [Nonomuraea sp. NPDC026600]|uniref:serine hydrolase domain-containing protein n=1 Tax=Nonomuraea sp. NPDC026600 TaxID=3155363 RepID=UPI0033E70193
MSNVQSSDRQATAGDFVSHWQERLDFLRAKHHVPGAALAVLVDGEIHKLASGVLSQATGMEVRFVVLGRIIEVLTGKTWDQAMKDLLLPRWELERSMTLPEEALRFRAAMGHLGAPGQDPDPAPVWAIQPRSTGPVARVVVSAGDMVRFARMQLDGGLAPDGTCVLSAESVAEMQRREVDSPDRRTVSADGWGLGWSVGEVGQVGAGPATDVEYGLAGPQIHHGQQIPLVRAARGAGGELVKVRDGRHDRSQAGECAVSEERATRSSALSYCLLACKTSGSSATSGAPCSGSLYLHVTGVGRL